MFYLHKYLHYTYFLGDTYTTLTTTYNTYITILTTSLAKFNYSWSIYKCIICILIVRASNKNFVCYLHYMLY